MSCCLDVQSSSVGCGLVDDDGDGVVDGMPTTGCADGCVVAIYINDTSIHIGEIRSK